jgi:D-amino-acid dehydrogenase
MKIIVIGAGLIGVTTAYFLRKKGYEVTVIDREEGPGQATSFANGALLTPSMSNPWNAPGCWRVLLASLVRSDAPLQLRPRALASILAWGSTFLRHSGPARYRCNTLSNMQLSLYSLEVLEALSNETRIEYGHTTRGALKIFRDRSNLDRSCVVAQSLSSYGLKFCRLCRDETLALEPGLAPMAQRLVGALYFPADETGDAYRFCVALAEHARTLGVQFHFGASVASLEVRWGQVSAVRCAKEHLVADRFVVAAGSYSAPLLRPLGIRLPVRPAKGYSITYSLQGQRPLTVPVIDDDLHAAVVPLEGAIRVAGTAEFAGYDLRIDPARVRNLSALLREVLPQVRFDEKIAKTWCGLRPMSADGVPIIGPTGTSNLWLNTGHGHLGWTMAAGSAKLFADLMSGERPFVDAAPFALRRFS